MRRECNLSVLGQQQFTARSMRPSVCGVVLCHKGHASHRCAATWETYAVGSVLSRRLRKASPWGWFHTGKLNQCTVVTPSYSLRQPASQPGGRERKRERASRQKGSIKKENESQACTKNKTEKKKKREKRRGHRAVLEPFPLKTETEAPGASTSPGAFLANSKRLRLVRPSWLPRSST